MKTLLFSFALLISLVAASQQFKTTVSETYDNKASASYSLSISNARLHLLRTQKGAAMYMSVGVRKTDVTDRTVLAETKSEMRIREPLGIKFLKAGGKVYIIYQETEKKGNAGNIMAVEVDTITLALSEPRIIGNLESSGYTAKISLYTNSYRFHWKTSPDGQTILALMSNDKTAAEFYTAVYDSDLMLKWEAKQQLPHSHSDVVQQDAAVDNKGQVYVAYRLLAKNKASGHIAIYQTGKKIKDLALQLGTSSPHDIKLLASANAQKVHVAGLYVETYWLALRGAYCTSVNSNDLSVGKIIKDAVPSLLVEQFSADGWGNAKQGNNYGLHHSITSQLKETAQYDPFITGEFRSTDLSMSNKSYHFSGSILHVYFINDKIQFNRLPKYRVSTTYLIGDSYSVFPWQNKVIIFYNDHPDNLQRDISQKPVNSNVYSNVVMVAAVIDPQGGVKRHVVLDLKKENFVAITDQIKQINHQFFVPTYQVKTLGGINDNFRMATVEVY